MRRRAAEKQPVDGLARAAGVVIRRCSRQSPPEPASRTLRGQPGPVPGVPAVPEPSGRHWCLPEGSGSLAPGRAAEVGDVRPLALAAAAGVRHVDGRGTTAGGLPSAREQVRSHANAAWRPLCAVRLAGDRCESQMSARKAPKHGRGASSTGPVHGLAAAAELAGPRGPPRWGQPSRAGGVAPEWRVAFHTELRH